MEITIHQDKKKCFVAEGWFLFFLGMQQRYKLAV